MLPPQVFRDEVFSEGFFLGSEDLHGKDLFGDDDSDTDDFAFDPAFGNSPIPSHLHASIHIDKAPFPPFDLNDDLNELDEDDYEPELHLPAPVAVHPLDVLGSVPVGGDDFDEDYSDTDQPFVPPAPLAPTATLTLTFNSAADDLYDPDTTYTGELHSSPAQSTSKILSYNDAAYDDEEFRPTVTSSSRKRSKSSKSDSSAKRKASGGDPSALPYGCNYPSCMDKGKGKDSEDYEELSTDENSFRTIRDLRDHIDEHKRLGDRAGDVPFRCAFESCGKTFKVRLSLPPRMLTRVVPVRSALPLPKRVHQRTLLCRDGRRRAARQKDEICRRRGSDRGVSNPRLWQGIQAICR